MIVARIYQDVGLFLIYGGQLANQASAVANGFL